MTLEIKVFFLKKKIANDNVIFVNLPLTHAYHSLLYYIYDMMIDFAP